jgi:hypothetical protein
MCSLCWCRWRLEGEDIAKPGHCGRCAAKGAATHMAERGDPGGAGSQPSNGPLQCCRCSSGARCRTRTCPSMAGSPPNLGNFRNPLSFKLPRPHHPSLDASSSANTIAAGLLTAADPIPPLMPHDRPPASQPFASLLGTCRALKVSSSESLAPALCCGQVH